jgi:hypothetical protein
MKRSEQVKYVVILLLCIAIAYCGYKLYTGEWYGEIMDRLCMAGGCGTPEGAQKARDECLKERNGLPGYKFMKRACESTDKNFRDLACAETCETSDVSPDILDKPDLGCKTPQVSGEDQYGNKYCLNGQDQWILLPGQTDLKWSY